MSLDAAHLFFRQWLRAPLQTGAVLPSGGALVRALADQLDPHDRRTVVELGPGTGAVTRALLKRGIPPERLVLVERNPAFVSLLHHRFPRVRVLQADATELQGLVAEGVIGPVGQIVSSLPLRSLPFAVQRGVLRAAFRVLPPGGRFLQYTYGLTSPVQPVLRQRLGLVGHPVTRVLLNIPPAVVWSFVAAETKSLGRLKQAA
jgi:phosphatidylethanolamine/phosphatidyl-N-methylethanolamine N-methyltransferase